MNLQQMYMLSYMLLGGMLCLLLGAAIYGTANDIKKAIRFTRKYKQKNLMPKKIKQPKKDVLEENETVLLEENNETQILIQDETFYGIECADGSKNVLNI